MNLMKRIWQRWAMIRFKWKGVKFERSSTIHSTVDFLNPSNVSLGDRSILYKQISVYPGKSGSIQIGQRSHIAPFGYLLVDNNHLKIGDDVAIGPFCTIICHSNDIKGENKLFSKNYLDADVTIGNNVFVGAHCTILPGTIIENNVVVASNSVVKGTLNEGGVYGGTPAKRIKDI